MGNGTSALAPRATPTWSGWPWLCAAVVGVCVGQLLHTFLQQQAADEPGYKEVLVPVRRHSEKISQLSMERCVLEGQVRILQREMNQLRVQMRDRLLADKGGQQLRTNTPIAGITPSVPEVAPNNSTSTSIGSNNTPLSRPSSNDSPTRPVTWATVSEKPCRRPLIHLHRVRKGPQKKCTQVDGIDVFTGNPVRQKTQPNSVLTSGVATPGPTPLETPVERNNELQMRQIDTSLRPFTRLTNVGSDRMTEDGGTCKMLSPIETYAPVSTPSCLTTSPMPTALASPVPRSSAKITQRKQRSLTRFVFD